MRDDNYKKRVLEYFRKNITKGYSVDTLKWALIKQGNSRSIVEIAMKEVQEEMAQASAPVEPKVEYIGVEDVQPEEQPKKSFWKRLFGRD